MRESKRTLYLFGLICLILTICSCSGTRHFNQADVKGAQKLIGLDFEKTEIDVMMNYLERNRSGYDSLRSYTLENSVFPALLFDPLPKGFELPTVNRACEWVGETSIQMPENINELAFASISDLAYLIRTGRLKSEELTKMYLDRINKHDGKIHSVITRIEEEALLRARELDREIERGHYRGPLHGIPYGLKDLISVKGFRTTWGATPYKNQVIDETATIVKRIDDAGGVLIAKLTSGALARGDVWFGGQTMNPWDTSQGASGSSAGSGAATAAGLVGFSIGTETLGSITSPSNRNGVTGLRPTYGRVSRSGVMSLSWSMDKVGPICRNAADCAIVFEAIQGLDNDDPSTYDIPFCFQPEEGYVKLKIGYLGQDIEKDTTTAGENLRKVVSEYENLGYQFIPDSLPDGFPFSAFDIILRAEAGAFFEEMTRDGRVDQMVQQDQRSRANSLRQSRFIPAVEYIQANRHRRMLIEAMNVLMRKYDALIVPTFGQQLMITNLTGHPVITLPTGFDEKGRPTSFSILGNLFEEEKILYLAKVFQDHTEYEGLQPPTFSVESGQ